MSPIEETKPIIPAWVDPPSGWQFGFPKTWPADLVMTNGNLSKFLLDNGYPVEDIAFALKYTHYGV